LILPAAIAAGHDKTAEAASHILDAGGNVFDAALAALCAACVVEPVLASLGGGGFLLARQADGQSQLFDFFAQTPHQRCPTQDLDFHPVEADFGHVQQQFHVGMGSIAVPGMVRGLFSAHRALGSIPMDIIMEPAIHYARQGVTITPQQAYIFTVVAPIYLFSESARNLYGKEKGQRRLPRAGEQLQQPQLADTLEALVREGDALFYEGEMANLIHRQCAERGGQVTREDLAAYRCIERQPLKQPYRDHEFLTNPAPSAGGPLIAFGLSLLSDISLDWPWGSHEHISSLIGVMAHTQEIRATLQEAEPESHRQLLDNYRRHLRAGSLRTRGTTHISLVDDAGNAAALSLSNGEGCGHMLPGTGIMLNNILGEEDLNPQGFHRWPNHVRLGSMMAPSILHNQETLIVTGSGGSNRLRNAILQTLVNLADFHLPVAEAVAAPRLHLEKGLLNLEPGFPAETLAELATTYPNQHLWDERNLFFGGTHTVTLRRGKLEGAGDPRRAGAYLIWT
jgi:gamma-glutamyltranspeptidase/glutathione hydrolase